MKKIIIICSLVIIAIQSNSQTTILGSMMSGGINRTYRLYVPAIYDVNHPCPLIINMHGYTSNALQQQLYTGFQPIADTANFLMVYPQGTLDGNGITFWNAGIGNGMVDDIGFLSNLIDTLKSHYNINLNRVYSTGFSMGGFMSHVLAIALNNRIAAIASVSGTFFTYQYPYIATKAIPVLQMHGTSDPTVPYTGSNNMVPVDSTIKFWVKSNHCNAVPIFSIVPNINTTDGCTAEHYLYNNGDNGSTVEFFKIIGGAHSWPSGSVNNGVTNRDIEASKEIWRFFNQYSLVSTGVNDLGNSMEASVYLHPNPSSEYVTVSFDSDNYSTLDISIFNSIGQKVISQLSSNEQKNIIINTAILPVGIYHVQVLADKKKYLYKKLIIVR